MVVMMLCFRVCKAGGLVMLTGHTCSAVSGSEYCTSAWKPWPFSKVAIFWTRPKALNTRCSVSNVTLTSGYSRSTECESLLS